MTRLRWPKFANGGRIVGVGQDQDSIPVLISEGCTYFPRSVQQHDELLKLINDESAE